MSYKLTDAFVYFSRIELYIKQVGWLFKFYGISTFIGYLMPDLFFIQINDSISNNSVSHEYTVCQNHFYFKLSSFVKKF